MTREVLPGPLADTILDRPDLQSSRGYLTGVPRLRSYIPFAVSIVLVVGAWWAYTVVSRVPSFLVPSPSEVLSALYAGLVSPPNAAAGYLPNLAVTLESTLLGFGAGVFLGIVMAVLAASFRTAERIIMPYAAALQSLPKLALAPLFLLWFGYGILSKVVLVTLLAFFPVLVNTYRGIKETDPLLLDVMRCQRASKGQTLWHVQLPHSLPFLFAGLSVAIVDALLGAIVAEFVGSTAGIGVQIIQFQDQNDVAAVFGALAILGVAGAILSALVEIIRRRVVVWGP